MPAKQRRHLEHLRRMGSVNLVVVVESVRVLITHNAEEQLNDFHIPSLIAVGAALGAWAASSCN